MFVMWRESRGNIKFIIDDILNVTPENEPMNTSRRNQRNGCAICLNTDHRILFVFIYLYSSKEVLCQLIFFSF